MAETESCSDDPKSLQMVTAAMKVKDACSWKKSYDQPRQHIKPILHANDLSLLRTYTDESYQTNQQLVYR